MTIITFLIFYKGKVLALDEKIIAYTENPARELLSVASRTNLSLNELDFSLLAFSTQYRFGDLEWEKISEKELILFDKDEIFLKNDLQIKQEYKIEIFPRYKPKQSISSSQTSCK